MSIVPTWKYTLLAIPQWMSSWGLYSQTWNKASVSYWAVCGAGLRNGTASWWNQCPRRPQWSCGAPGRTHSPTAPSYLTRKQIWTLMLLTRLCSWKWLARPLLTHCQNWSEDDDAGSLTFAKESPDSSHLSLSVDLLSPVKRTAQGTLNWELPLLSRSLKRQHAEMIKCFLRFAALGPFGVRFNCSNRFVVLAAKQLKSPNLTFKKYCTKISEDWPDLRKYSSHLSKCLQSLVDTV